MVNTKDYLNLSALAYVDFESVDKGKTIGSLVDGVENGTMSRKDFNINSPEFSALQNSSNPLRSWKLIAQSPSSVREVTKIKLNRPRLVLLYYDCAISWYCS